MIPDYQTIMLPFLELLSDGKEHELRTLIKQISDKFELTDDERKELLPSENQEIINNRVGWARTYLKKANLLTAPRRATFVITEQGQKILQSKPKKIDVKLLQSLPEFKEWQTSYQTNYQNRKEDENTAIATIELDNTKTPEELLDYSYIKLKDELASELIEKVKLCTPRFFERLVVELLVKMGYGGSYKDAGKATQLTNDEGIDGIIKEDKLGLDVIYIQAKRWTDTTVGRPEIQSFVGALDGKRANKGIFITTSRFADTAIEYVKTITKKVILIDGKELAELMIEHNVGIATKNTYEIKRIDFDYFEEI